MGISNRTTTEICLWLSYVIKAFHLVRFLSCYFHLFRVLVIIEGPGGWVGARHGPLLVSRSWRIWKQDKEATLIFLKSSFSFFGRKSGKRNIRHVELTATTSHHNAVEKRRFRAIINIVENCFVHLSICILAGIWLD